MDEKNEELVDAQIVEEDSRMYGHAEGEPGGEVADESGFGEQRLRCGVDPVVGAAVWRVLPLPLADVAGDLVKPGEPAESEVVVGMEDEVGA